MSTKFLTLLGLAATSFTSTVLAQGNSYVTNDCPNSIYIQYVDQVVGATGLVELAAGAPSWTMPISTNPGVAIKVWNSTDTSMSPIELDYTLQASGDYQALYYNLGAETDSAFTAAGYGIIPSNVDGGACSWDFCSAGVQNCGNAAVTHTCPVGSDLNLYVCSG